MSRIVQFIWDIYVRHGSFAVAASAHIHSDGQVAIGRKEGMVSFAARTHHLGLAIGDLRQRGGHLFVRLQALQPGRQPDATRHSDLKVVSFMILICDPTACLLFVCISLIKGVHLVGSFGKGFRENRIGRANSSVLSFSRPFLSSRKQMPSDNALLMPGAVFTLGDEVWQLRKVRQLALKELGVQAGISLSHKSSIERWALTLSVYVLRVVAAALGVTLDCFFSRWLEGANERAYVVQRKTGATSMRSMGKMQTRLATPISCLPARSRGSSSRRLRSMRPSQMDRNSHC